jgi:hypothetical protein
MDYLYLQHSFVYDACTDRNPRPRYLMYGIFTTGILGSFLFDYSLPSALLGSFLFGELMFRCILYGYVCLRLCI